TTTSEGEIGGGPVSAIEGQLQETVDAAAVAVASGAQQLISSHGHGAKTILIYRFWNEGIKILRGVSLELLKTIELNY
ncbi:hypothetical protein Tco_0027119, partial [Tanacetum coccineum]